MVDVVNDDLVWPLMDQLRDCVCTELEKSPGGAPCFCALLPGETVIAEHCGCETTTAGCGMAWVRLANIYPSTQFPIQDTGTSSCTAGLAAVLELGAYRCLPTLGAGGAPPGALAQAQAVQTQMGDWRALLRAVKCCPALTPLDKMLGRYDPRSLGGCGGGVLTVTVRLSKAPR